MRLAVFVTLLTLMVAPAAAQGVAAPLPDCPVPNPRTSAAWQAFEALVRNEYLDRMRPPLTHQMVAMAFGHALGRAAIAVEGRRDRQLAFACIEQSLEQFEALGFLAQTGLATGVVMDMRTVRMAGMGMFNTEIAALVRGVSNAPVPHVLGGTPATPEGSLAGDWDDGGVNTIRVVSAGNGFEGFYTDRLGEGHRSAGFAPGEIGFRFIRADPSVASGWQWRVEIKWRTSGGNTWWQQGFAARRGDQLLFNIDGVTTSTPWRRIGS